MRSWFYFWARLMGDASAVKRRRVGKRIANKLIGRYVVSRLWIR